MLSQRSNQTKTILFLFIPAILVYMKSLYYEFSPLDDQWMIVDSSKELSQWSNIKTFFTKPLAGLYFRPVFSLSLMVDYHLGKTAPFVYHFSNLLYHLISVFLVYKLLTALGISETVALLFGMVFSVHPALVHAIAWVPGRNDTLLAIFSLSSLLFFLKFTTSTNQKHLWLHVLFFALALLTKENAILLPALFGLLLFNFRLPKKHTLIICTTWLLIGCAWFILRRNCVSSSLSLTAETAQTIQKFLMAVCLYIGKSLYPVHQSVFPTLQNSRIIYGIISLAIYVLISFKPGIKNKFLALLGIGMFLVFISIPAWYGASSVLGEHYEHRMYLPLIGLLIFISQLNINYQAPSFKYVSYAVLGLYGVTSFIRLNVYATKSSFIEAGTKEAPDYYFFYTAKADLLLLEQNYASSIPLYDKSISMQPKRAQLYSARGSAYTSMGKTDQAISDFTKAIDLSSHPDMYLNRCLAYQLAGNYRDAYKDFEYLKKNSPQTIPAGLEHDLLEQLYILSLKEIDTKIKEEPRNSILFIHKAKLLIAKNKTAESKAYIEAACKMEPANKMYQHYLQQINERIK